MRSARQVEIEQVGAHAPSYRRRGVRSSLAEIAKRNEMPLYDAGG